MADPMSNMICNGGMFVDRELRQIFFCGEIDPIKAMEFAYVFRSLDASDGNIRIIISSEGGSIADGYIMYDTIMASRNKVITEAYGILYSMAVMVFQAGDKRLLAPQCEVMIHDVLIALDGEVSTKEVSRLNKDMRGSNKRYQQLLAKHTKMPLKRINKLCKKESFFTAEKAVELGLADDLFLH
jgi:ATP-dependent Clp protease protease subunit